MFVITASHEEILRRAGAYVGTDPLEPALGLMRDGTVRFHGPEHHYLTAACLCAAWCNALGEDKREHMERLLSRCARIPPAVCGYYGVCGGSMAAGACASELLGANYLSGESWQRGKRAHSPHPSRHRRELQTRPALLQAHDLRGFDRGVRMAARGAGRGNYGSRGLQMPISLRK